MIEFCVDSIKIDFLGLGRLWLFLTLTFLRLTSDLVTLTEFLLEKDIIGINQI